MSILTWLRSKLASGQITMTQIDSTEFWGLASSIYVRELALQSVINLVAKAVAKCEFKTYLGGKEFHGEEYYLWNVNPNINQSSTVFLTKLVTKLYQTNECLVIESADRQLLVADSFQAKKNTLYGNTYHQVTVDDFTFNTTFRMQDVLFFQLNNSDVMKLVSGLHESYGKLAEYSQKAYQKARGQKGVLEISAEARGKPEFEKTLSQLMNERFKTYFEADNAVLPLTSGYKFNESDKKTYSNETTRDIRAQIDDVFVFTARAAGVAPALVLGDTADLSKAVDNLLTFCVDPVCDMIQEEINRKRYGSKSFLSGTRLQIDTKAMKHVDLLSVATAVDKLIASGAFCINDIRKLVGEEPIDEPWAWQHWMTKNYSPAEDVLNALAEKGGADG